MRSAVVVGSLCLGLAAFAEDRVQKAREHKAEEVHRIFQVAGVVYPPGEVYLRVFKRERELELWAGARSQPLKLVRTYKVCASSGTLGPKRREGDEQVPEGFYRLAAFNPTSTFHLALRVDYPNASDRILGDAHHLGGDIMIHGNCVTIGCIPIEDGPIEEVYLATWDARQHGQGDIPVHIFPGRMDAKGWQALQRVGDAPLQKFWASLRPGYEAFEASKRPPRVTVDASGEYRVFSEATRP